jgi:hypothetical protein
VDVLKSIKIILYIVLLFLQYIGSSFLLHLYGLGLVACSNSQLFIIISGSEVLVRTLAASHRRFLNLGRSGRVSNSELLSEIINHFDNQ